MKKVKVTKEVELWECEICGKQLHSKDAMQTHGWTCWEIHEKRPWYPVGSYVVTWGSRVCKVTGGEMDSMGFDYELCDLDATVLKDGLPSEADTFTRCRVDGISASIDPSELYDLLQPVREALEMLGKSGMPGINLRAVDSLHLPKFLQVILHLGPINAKKKE